ncbi:MAG TPA: prephenate dehydratase [Candidatus Acidoferrales bacterium]|nr:prephenate dehydratase [Candidatus Acidoferrales bacterium]
MARTKTSLDALRTQIDRIDEKLLALLNQRARLVIQVGEQKRHSKASIYVPSREKHIFQRLERVNRGPLTAERIRPIFREIISVCLSLEQPLRIACLGPLGTYSHQAVLEQFGTRTTVVPVDSFSEVFDEVEHQRVDYGVVPVENSIEGVVAATLDRFVDSPLTIRAEVLLRVDQCLLTRSGRAERLKRIVSHPQSLAQCRHWLQQHYPGVEQVEAGSNSQAAQQAANDPRVAAIAGRVAASLYGLRVVASNIQDHAHNFTRFLILGRDGIGHPSGDDKTSVVLSAPHEAGALYRVLKPFADNRVSLCNIESRPIKGRQWEYVFFIDMVGHVEDERVTRALRAVKASCLFCKILGSYPTAARPL